MSATRNALLRIPRVGDDSAHAVWKRPATARRRRHAPRDPPRTSSTATTLPVTCRVLRAGPSSPRRSRGSHAPLILVAATSSRAPREQGRRRAAAGSANAADPSNYTSSSASVASRRSDARRFRSRLDDASAAITRQPSSRAHPLSRSAASRRAWIAAVRVLREPTCLLIVKASCRRLASMPSADGDALTAVRFTATCRRAQPCADHTRGLPV